MPLPTSGDLFIYAKDLFIAANVAGIHRTEIDRTATDARATSEGSRVGPCPTPRIPCPGGYPARVRLSVPKIYKIQESRRSKDLLLLCSLKPPDYSVFSPEITMAKVNLSGMSVEALMDLRKRVDETLHRRWAELEKQLERMDRAIAVVGGRGASVLKGRKVPPKYRGPSGKTWSGRGAKPRWLVAAIKGGKKLDDFLIDKSARKGRRKPRSKR